MGLFVYKNVASYTISIKIHFCVGSPCCSTFKDKGDRMGDNNQHTVNFNKIRPEGPLQEVIQ